MDDTPDLSEQEEQWIPWGGVPEEPPVELTYRGYERQLANTPGVHMAPRFEPLPECCWFCDRASGATTREHIFPGWLQRRFGAESRSGEIVHYGSRGRGVLDTRGPFPMSALAVGSVCGDCNSGWMSSLESAFKPLLESVLGGGAVSGSDAEIAARWFCKTATAINVSQQRRILIPASSRAGLRHGVPEGFHVWWVRSKGRDNELSWIQGGGPMFVTTPRGVDEDAVFGPLYRVMPCAVRVGALTALVFFAPFPVSVVPVPELTPLWPPVGRPSRPCRPDFPPELAAMSWLVLADPQILGAAEMAAAEAVRRRRGVYRKFCEEVERRNADSG